MQMTPSAALETRSGDGPDRVIGYPDSLGGLTTRVLECGAGSSDVVLLHGASSRADRWTPVLPALARAGYRVRAIDLPGHGFAEKPAEFDYSTPAITSLVESYLDEHGPAVLVGTSLGAHVAAWLACERPDLVPALVLVGATGFVRRDTSASTAIADRSIDGVRGKVQLLLHDTSVVDERWIVEESRINTSPGAEDALDRVLAYLREGINEHLIGDRLAATRVPTRLVWGVEDQWIPVAIAHQVAALLPEAPLYLMRSAGHAPYFERPDAFCEVVLQFLADPRHQNLGTFEV